MNTTARKLATPAAFPRHRLPLGIGAMIAMGEDPEEAEKASHKAAFQSISTAASRPQERLAEARGETVTRRRGTGSAGRRFATSRIHCTYDLIVFVRMAIAVWHELRRVDRARTRSLAEKAA